MTSRPRMMGRLEAPGAKLDPVMPGFSNRRSPSVDAPLRRNSAFGTTVMVANWFVTIGIVPTNVSGAGAAGVVGAGSPGAGWADAGWAGARRIGLATVTSICGSAVCARRELTHSAKMQIDALLDVKSSSMEDALQTPPDLE